MLPSGGCAVSLLEVRNLSVRFSVRTGAFSRSRAWLQAVDGASMDVEAGSTLGLVGESGCGKSTTARAILRLVEPDAGSVVLGGQDVRALGGAALRRFRRHMQVVFQDPMSSLDPRRTAFQAVSEGLEVHGICPAPLRRDRVAEIFRRVGLSGEHLDRHPHEFSGGQRQRIGIARALAVEPRLLVLDEPVSALDVSVQAQVLNLLEDLRDERGMGYLFVAHDMGVVRHFCDRIAVMYLGRIVEEGPAEDVCRSPLHPYTRLLIDSVPALGARRRSFSVPSGELPSPLAPPSGCAFHPRCPMAVPECSAVRPELLAVDGNRRVACPRSGF
jgi:peptide/nickel transport system ATP-binding protein